LLARAAGRARRSVGVSSDITAVIWIAFALSRRSGTDRLVGCRRLPQVVGGSEGSTPPSLYIGLSLMLSGRSSSQPSRSRRVPFRIAAASSSSAFCRRSCGLGHQRSGSRWRDRLRSRWIGLGIDAIRRDRRPVSAGPAAA
jgi:hypothetical protein